MHNDVTTPHPARRFSRLAVAVSLLTVPATPAYALSLGEVAHTVASSPWACFGLGCAAGAVVGGLVVGLMGLRSRKRLEERVEDAVYAAEMAQQSAEAAERLLREAQRIIAAQAQAQAAATIQSAQPQASAASEATVAAEAPRKRPAHVPAHVATVPKVAELEHIEPEPKPKPVASAPQTSTMSAAERAASIDARVPGFDQSLFPDLVHESTPKEDDFMLAMKAMDETLSATLMLSPREEEKEEEQLFGVEPEFADAASYVDYLVQDEIERNRAGQARRFSRSQLTVFEGTGDINSMHKSQPRKRPRHLAPAAREA